MAIDEAGIEMRIQENSRAMPLGVLVTTRPISKTYATVKTQSTYPPQERQLTNKNPEEVLYSGLAAVGLAGISIGIYFLSCKIRNIFNRRKRRPNHSSS